MCLANIAQDKTPSGRASADISQYRGEQLIVGSVVRRISSPFLSSSLFSWCKEYRGGEEGGKKTRPQGKQCVLFESLANVAVIMACRDYYAIARRWNIKWTAIDRLNIKSLRNVVFIVRIMPFFARFLLFPDFFSRERERKKMEIDGTSRITRENIWREKSLRINQGEAHLTK